MRISLSVFLLFLLFICGCAKAEPDNFIDIVFDPCDSISIDAQAISTDEQYQAIQDSIRMWNDLLGASIKLHVPGPYSEFPLTKNVFLEDADRTIPVVFDKAAEAFRGYYDDENGVIYINDRLAKENIAFTLAHEIGHAFGLFHIEEDVRISVMNHGNMTIAPNLDDAADVEKLWGRCSARARPTNVDFSTENLR